MKKRHFRLQTFILATATLLASTAVHADIHALIMTISNYQGGIPPLKGVAYDADSARTIAKDMGAKDGNILELRDQQLTLAGMRKAFDDLIAQVQPDDSVFIYYSGHGGRQYVQDPVERCAESLITDDGYGFIDTEMEAKLKQLSKKAQKVVVFLDACHSGGVTTRAVRAGKQAAFAPKYWSKGEAEACSKPVNMLTRSIRLATLTPGSGAQNYVYIAAARDNEISLDQPGKGGVATQAWLACMSGEAKDLDGSGGITADEIRQCAQQKIDAALSNVEGYLPHHITITGNPNAVLSLKQVANPAPSAPATPVEPVADNGGAKPVEPPPSPPSAVPAPYNTLKDIYNGRDDRRVVALKAAKPILTIGKDRVDFSLTSSHPGYVYLLMMGSDGKSFDLLFPNQLDKSNYIQAGDTLRFPRPNWDIIAQGPAGQDHLLAIVSDAPRDFAKLGLQPAGPFSIVEANQASAKDIHLVTATSSRANSSECSSNGITKRNLSVQKVCSDAYGAALATIEEVE